MAMVISTNTASINAQRHLNSSRQDLDVAMERLSSGQRINSAADDAAGLAIRDKMTSQIEGLNQAVRNANDAISFMQTAEGALEETTSILQRMRTLAVQAVNDTNTNADRTNLNDELEKLQEEITRIGNNSTFNNKLLINGDMATTADQATFQIGHNAEQTIQITLNDMRAEALGIKAAVGEVAGTYSETVVTFAAPAAATYASTDVQFAVITASVTNDTASVTIDGQVFTTGDLSTYISADAAGLANLGAKFAALSVDGWTITDNGLGNVTFARNQHYNTAIHGKGADGQTAIGTDVNADLTTTDFGTVATTATKTDSAAGEAGVTDGDTLSVTIGGQTFTTGDIIASRDTTAEKIGDLFTAISDTVTGWDVSNTGGVVTFKKNADYVGGTTGGSLTDTGQTNLASGSGGAVADGATLAITVTGSSNTDDTYTATVVDDTGAKVAASATEAQTFAISAIDLESMANATAAINSIDQALLEVGQERSKLGAFQNRLQFAVNNMTNMSANTSAARSLIADADYAAESSSLAKNQILQQAGTAMLAQANAQAQSVLSLLK